MNPPTDAADDDARELLGMSDAIRRGRAVLDRIVTQARAVAGEHGLDRTINGRVARLILDVQAAAVASLETTISLLELVADPLRLKREPPTAEEIAAGQLGP